MSYARRHSTNVCPGNRVRYTVSLSDSGGLADSDMITVTVQAISEGDFTLSASGYKVEGTKYADLSWGGTNAGSVFVFRNVTQIVSTGNDGEYTDVIGKGGGGSYTYEVCEDAGRTMCSNSATVVF